MLTSIVGRSTAWTATSTNVLSRMEDVRTSATILLALTSAHVPTDKLLLKTVLHAVRLIITLSTIYPVLTNIFVINSVLNDCLIDNGGCEFECVQFSTGRRCMCPNSKQVRLACSTLTIHKQEWWNIALCSLRTKVVLTITNVTTPTEVALTFARI